MCEETQLPTQLHFVEKQESHLTTLRVTKKPEIGRTREDDEELPRQSRWSNIIAIMPLCSLGETIQSSPWRLQTIQRDQTMKRLSNCGTVYRPGLKVT
jgi:hypothetical protein